MFAGDKNAFHELHTIIKDISSQKKALLLNAGFPNNYLEPIYTCNNCKDTGYVDNKKCICFKQAIIATLYSQSNIQNMLNETNFKCLSYEYYSGVNLTNFKLAVKASENFIKFFNAPYQNLLFYGTVGTGKSFLSGCIAKELLDQGYLVLYFSSQTLFDTLSKYTFNYQNKGNESDLLNDIFSCDLLIIDDLGTEMSSKFVSSQLFKCVNERHLRKKSTIISTNLSLEQLLNVYSERIFSRITTQYTVFKLTGDDIRRLQKKHIKAIESEVF
jgi:DNA replication protein DnaC